MRDIKLNPIKFVLDTIEENFSNTKIETEYVNLLASHNRIVAEDIISNTTIPEFPKSTVDGYAIKNMKSSEILMLAGNVEIGNANYCELEDGECVYVPTGGMIPSGTEVMVKIEETTKPENNKIQFNKPYMNRENIIEIGDDLKIGDALINKGEVISAFDIGAFASIGLGEVPVLKKPLVSIISTGDELVEGDKELLLGQVRDINTKTLSVLSKEFGLEIVKTYIVNDDYGKLERTISDAFKISDIVLISGGSSVGERDYTYDLINNLGSPGVLTDGMALKPGKPTIIGKVDGKPVIGLPGHPVSAVMVFRIIMKKLLSCWGFLLKDDLCEDVILKKRIYPAIGRDTYQMVSVKDGYAYPTSGKSGMISLLTGSDGYVIVPSENEFIEAGEVVKCHYF